MNHEYLCRVAAERCDDEYIEVFDLFMDWPTTDDLLKDWNRYRWFGTLGDGVKFGYWMNWAVNPVPAFSTYKSNIYLNYIRLESRIIFRNMPGQSKLFDGDKVYEINWNSQQDADRDLNSMCDEIIKYCSKIRDERAKKAAEKRRNTRKQVKKGRNKNKKDAEKKRNMNVEHDDDDDSDDDSDDDELAINKRRNNNRKIRKKKKTFEEEKCDDECALNIELDNSDEDPIENAVESNSNSVSQIGRKRKKDDNQNRDESNPKKKRKLNQDSGDQVVEHAEIISIDNNHNKNKVIVVCEDEESELVSRRSRSRNNKKNVSKYEDNRCQRPQKYSALPSLKSYSSIKRDGNKCKTKCIESTCYKTLRRLSYDNAREFVSVLDEINGNLNSNKNKNKNKNRNKNKNKNKNKNEVCYCIYFVLFFVDREQFFFM